MQSVKLPRKVFATKLSNNFSIGNKRAVVECLPTKEEKVKPFIKLEELRLRLDTIFFVGSLVHFIFSMVYVFCLFTR